MGYMLSVNPGQVDAPQPWFPGTDCADGPSAEYRLLIIEGLSIGDLHDVLVESEEQGWILEQVLPVERIIEPLGGIDPRQLGILLRRERSA